MSRVPRAATFFVTRPRSDAAPLCAALRGAGRDAVPFPVLAIEPAADEEPLQRAMARVDGYGLVVFVSPNAIRRALAVRATPWPAATIIGVMGPGSVAALRAAGVGARIVSPTAAAPDADRFDSEALFAALAADCGGAAAIARDVLIVRGNGGRGWLADRLREVGCRVDEVEAYRRVRPQLDTEGADALRRVQATNGAAVFIVTSSEGFEHLDALVAEALAPVTDAASAATWLRHATVLAPHERIAVRARDCGFTSVATCAPGDRGILAAIE